LDYKKLQTELYYFDLRLHVPSVRKCTDKRCMTCPSLIEGTSFTFKNGWTFTVMQDISCKTKNLVYAIICSNCGEFYVGETKKYIFHTFATVKFNLFHKMENIVIPWIIRSYKRNYIILIWGYMYLFPQFHMYRSLF
jgi:hypothetical protein